MRGFASLSAILLAGLILLDTLPASAQSAGARGGSQSRTNYGVGETFSIDWSGVEERNYRGQARADDPPPLPRADPLGGLASCREVEGQDMDEQGRTRVLGATQCYDSYGEAYIQPGSVYVKTVDGQPVAR